MRFDHLLTETATVTKRSPTGSRDSYGNVVLTAVSRTTDCYHEQTARDENVPVAQQTWKLFLPADDPLSSSDAVSVGGQSFEVVGPPWQTWNPRTSTSGQVEATLRRTDG